MTLLRAGGMVFDLMEVMFWCLQVMHVRMHALYVHMRASS